MRAIIDLRTLTDEYDKEITIHPTAIDKKTGEKMIVPEKISSSWVKSHLMGWKQAKNIRFSAGRW